MQRWKLFPREIEADLNLHHRIDVGDWHEGRVSSRRVLTLLDGLPSDTWYKLSVQRFLEWMREEEERRYRNEIKSQIFAQLSGQKFSV